MARNKWGGTLGKMTGPVPALTGGPWSSLGQGISWSKGSLASDRAFWTVGYLEECVVRQKPCCTWDLVAV